MRRRVGTDHRLRERRFADDGTGATGTWPIWCATLCGVPAEAGRPPGRKNRVSTGLADAGCESDSSGHCSDRRAAPPVGDVWPPSTAPIA